MEYLRLSQPVVELHCLLWLNSPIVTGCQGMRIADEEAYYQTVFTENNESIQHITYVNHRQWRDSNKEYKYIHGKQ